MGMQASPLHVMLCDGDLTVAYMIPVKRRSLEVVSLYEMLSSSVARGGAPQKGYEPNLAE